MTGTFRDLDAEADLVDVLVSTAKDEPCPCRLDHQQLRGFLLAELEPEDFTHPALRYAFRLMQYAPFDWASLAEALTDAELIAPGEPTERFLRWASGGGIHRASPMYLKRIRRARAFRAGYRHLEGLLARLHEGDERALEEAADAA